VASLSQGRTAAAQCGLFTHKSVPVIFEPPCIYSNLLEEILKHNLMLMTATDGFIAALAATLAVRNNREEFNTPRHKVGFAADYEGRGFIIEISHL